jgi:hypothetical protein
MIGRVINAINRIPNSGWFALFLCLQLGFFFVVLDASKHQKNSSPPRESWSQNSDSQKNEADKGSGIAPAIQIDCDPACNAKRTDKNGNQNAFARFIRKTIEDPLTVFTAILAVATLALAGFMQLQIRDGRKSSERQLRAYVMIDTVKIENIRMGGEPEVKLTFKNSGQTPATNLTHWARLSFNTFPEITGELPTVKKGERLPPGPLAPGGKIHLTTGIDRPLDAAVLNTIIVDRTHAFYIVGELRYVDAFGVPRETDFLLFSTGSFATEGSMASYKTGNHIT